jgi:TPP-dependent pyruvate/acetoin dehydrogenase alpha subunit
MKAWREKCPIKRLKDFLIKNSMAIGEEIRKIESEVEEEIENVAKFAEESPYPDPSTACEYVFHSFKEG